LTRRGFLRVLSILAVALNLGVGQAVAESGSGSSGSGSGSDNSGPGSDNSGPGGGGGDNSGPGGGDDGDRSGRGGRGGDHDRARDAVRHGRALPLSAFIASIERQYGGRLIDASLRERRGELVYELKMISDTGGRIFTVSVDAKTGRSRGLFGF
jgi:hypothetical protein